MINLQTARFESGPF